MCLYLLDYLIYTVHCINNFATSLDCVLVSLKFSISITIIISKYNIPGISEAMKKSQVLVSASPNKSLLWDCSSLIHLNQMAFLPILSASFPLCWIGSYIVFNTVNSRSSLITSRPDNACISVSCRAHFVLCFSLFQSLWIYDTSYTAFKNNNNSYRFPSTSAKLS